jgi:L-fuculose-phosphate aldolase
MSREIDEVKYEVAMATRILSHMGLATGVTAALGHVSMRVPNQPDKFVVKGRGYAIDALEEMQYYDMIVCDLDGYKVDGPANSTQCSEVKIHSSIYRERPEIQSVVHVHPRNVVLMTVLGEPIKPMAQEGGPMVLAQPHPLYPHTKTVWSDEEGMELANTLGGHKFVLMQGHGASMTGRDPQDSVVSMLQLEEQARMNYWAVAAKGSDHKRVPEEYLVELETRAPQHEYPHFKELMRRIGGNPPRDGVWNSYKKKVSVNMVAP